MPLQWASANVPRSQKSQNPHSHCPQPSPHMRTVHSRQPLRVIRNCLPFVRELPFQRSLPASFSALLGAHRVSSCLLALTPRNSRRPAACFATADLYGSPSNQPHKEKPGSRVPPTPREGSRFRGAKRARTSWPSTASGRCDRYSDNDLSDLNLGRAVTQPNIKRQGPSKNA